MKLQRYLDHLAMRDLTKCACKLNVVVSDSDGSSHVAPLLSCCPPPSKRRRVHQRPKIQPRQLAPLSDHYSFPVAPRQPNRNTTSRSSSPIQHTSLRAFDSSEPAQVSSPLTAISEPPLALPLTTTHGPRPRITFLSLPIEARHQIYAQALGPPTTIHVRQPGQVDPKRFLVPHVLKLPTSLWTL